MRCVSSNPSVLLAGGKDKPELDIGQADGVRSTSQIHMWRNLCIATRGKPCFQSAARAGKWSSFDSDQLVIFFVSCFFSLSLSVMSPNRTRKMSDLELSIKCEPFLDHLFHREDCASVSECWVLVRMLSVCIFFLFYLFFRISFVLFLFFSFLIFAEFWFVLTINWEIQGEPSAQHPHPFHENKGMCRTMWNHLPQIPQMLKAPNSWLRSFFRENPRNVNQWFRGDMFTLLFFFYLFTFCVSFKSGIFWEHLMSAEFQCTKRHNKSITFYSILF